MISSDVLTRTGGRRYPRIVLPTRRRRWRIDAGDVALPRQEPRRPTIAVVGIAQATDVLVFDFHPGRGGARR